MLDDLKHEIDSSRGRWVKLADKGDTIEGTVLAFEIRPMTFEGAPVLSRRSGEQRKEWLFTLQTNMRDDDDDDGIRKVPLKEAAQRAVRDAITEAKVAAPKAGDRLKIAVIADRETPTSQPSFRAKWTIGDPIDELTTTPPAPSDPSWEEEPF